MSENRSDGPGTGKRIVRLAVRDFKRITALDFHPDPNWQPVEGMNGNGKSSLLDAIECALAGKGAAPDRPVRDGADGARIVMDLDGLRITRTFTPDGRSSLVVKRTDGDTVSRPQTVLDGLVNALGFDPYEFVDLPAARQVEVLRKLLGLDLSDVDKALEDLESERAELNKSIGAQESKQRLDALDFVLPPDLPAEPIDVEGIEGEYRRARVRESVVREHAGHVMRWTNERERAEAEIERLSLEVVRIQEQLRVQRERETNAEAKLLALQETQPEPPDTEEILQRLTVARSTNQFIRVRQSREALARDVQANREHRELVQARIEAARDARRARIEAAPMPVPGLSFTDACILFNGVPFAQCSSAEKIRIGLAVMAGLNPDIRSVVVRGGAMLDRHSYAALRAWATDNDMQVFIERPDISGDSAAVVIQDGSIVKRES